MLFYSPSSSHCLLQFGYEHLNSLDHFVLPQLVLVLRVVRGCEENQLIQELQLLFPVEPWILQHPLYQFGFCLFFGLFCNGLVDVVDFFVKQQLSFLLLSCVTVGDYYWSFPWSQLPCLSRTLCFLPCTAVLVGISVHCPSSRTCQVRCLLSVWLLSPLRLFCECSRLSEAVSAVRMRRRMAL